MADRTRARTYTRNSQAHPDSPAGGGGSGHFNHRHAPASHHHAPPVSLVIYPGERVETHFEIVRGVRVRVDVVVGHIYVRGAGGESYQIAAGPRRPFLDRNSGHVAGPTQPGHYRLGPREHHTTKNWPSSTIPQGAKLRKGADGEVEFSSDGGGRWTKVTGPHGVFTEAYILMETTKAKQAGIHLDATAFRRHAIDVVRRNFLDDSGNLLIDTWRWNDFGVWSWRLYDLGAKKYTPYFIHATPSDEEATGDVRAFFLSQSHGCVHIKPKDRQRMMDAGFLKAGIRVDVKPYGAVGPPR